jgi:hypothetical protein
MRGPFRLASRLLVRGCDLEVGYIIGLFYDREHVRVRCIFDRTSIHRVITSSLLFLSDARISEAENPLGLKKKVACISLRPIQTRQ